MTTPHLSTIKRLYALSGNRCAFPECDTTLVDQASETLTGEICHIRARRPGGPRHDPGMGSDELHAFENLILLCATHHKVIDSDPESFTAEMIFRMKAEHEGRHKGGSPPGDEVVKALLASLARAITPGGTMPPAHNTQAPDVYAKPVRRRVIGLRHPVRSLKSLFAEDIRESHERHGRLIELRRPPESLLETLRRTGTLALSVRAKRFAYAAVFYYLWFGFDLWFVSHVGLHFSSMLDGPPPLAFLVQAVVFTYLAWVNHRLKGRMETRPLTLGGEKHLVRELTFEVEIEDVALGCVRALRATGALIFEIVRDEGDGRITVSAFKEHGGIGSRFTARAYDFDEVVVSILRDGDKCLVTAETSLGKRQDKSVAYINKFLKRLLGWTRK